MLSECCLNSRLNSLIRLICTLRAARLQDRAANLVGARTVLLYCTLLVFSDLCNEMKINGFFVIYLSTNYGLGLESPQLAAAPPLVSYLTTS